MKRRFYRIFNLTFIRVSYEITTTKWKSSKSFIHSISQLSVPPSIWGWRYATALISLYNEVASCFAPIKTMKSSNFVPSYFLLRQNKTGVFFRDQFSLEPQFFLLVSSTAVVDTIFAKAEVAPIAVVLAASFWCFMARRWTCKTKDNNSSISWSGSF